MLLLELILLCSLLFSQFVTQNHTESQNKMEERKVLTGKYLKDFSCEKSQKTNENGKY